MSGLSAQFRYVALGLGVIAVLGVGTYVGWSMLSGEEPAQKEASGDANFDESWSTSEAEAKAESPAPDESETSDEAETSDNSEESDERAKSDPSETSEESDERAKSDESDESREQREERKTVAEAESNETATVPTSVEVVDESTEEVTGNQLRGQQTARGNQERTEYKPAVLQVVTNFRKADVTVNGLPYPEYKVTQPGNDEENGMVLPAGGPYTVQVTYDGKKKTYTITLQPYKVRVLMVELSGFKGGAPTGPRTSSPSASTNTANARPEKNDDDSGEKGRVTVYSKPKGAIQVDGSGQDQKTPGTVEVSPGQHDIQVKFDDGNMSESKTVRVRKGSRIKLFFRKK